MSSNRYCYSWCGEGARKCFECFKHDNRGQDKNPVGVFCIPCHLVHPRGYKHMNIGVYCYQCLRYHEKGFRHADEILQTVPCLVCKRMRGHNTSCPLYEYAREISSVNRRRALLQKSYTKGYKTSLIKGEAPETPGGTNRYFDPVAMMRNHGK